MKYSSPQPRREINLEKIKDLQIYSASGLVKLKDDFYVVADDERSLIKFSLQNSSVQSIKLLTGLLPTDTKERKKLKPDWEALTYFPPETNLEGILIVPSGSKPNRQTGFFLNLDQKFFTPLEIDFSNLYKKLQESIRELNIEGAVIINSHLKLFQRGNGPSNQNAIIDLDLAKISTSITSSQSFSADCIIKISSFDLGKADHSPFSFTDAFTIDGFLYFLAVCEETTSTYDDGPFKGALLGQMSAEGKILATWKLNCPFKPEGLWLEKSGSGYKVFIVTDADSREQVSSLYTGKIHFDSE